MIWGYPLQALRRWWHHHPIRFCHNPSALAAKSGPLDPMLLRRPKPLGFWCFWHTNENTYLFISFSKMVYFWFLQRFCCCTENLSGLKTLVPPNVLRKWCFGNYDTDKALRMSFLHFSSICLSQLLVSRYSPSLEISMHLIRVGHFAHWCPPQKKVNVQSSPGDSDFKSSPVQI